MSQSDFEALSLAERMAVQERILIDEEKCALTEHRYGLITAKTVLYRGEDQTIEGIQYRNVEKYLVNGIVGESKDNIIKGQYEKSIVDFLLKSLHI